MHAASFIPALAMWGSLIGLVILAVAGGAILYACENVAAKNRHHD